MIFIGIIIGIIIGAIIQSVSNASIAKSSEQILKETSRFKYVFKDKSVIVYVNDQYEYEQKIVPVKETFSAHKKGKTTGISYEEALILNERKIDSKYFHPKNNLENETNFFFKKKIVITGTYYDFPDRNDLAKLFWEAGADIDTGIGKNTEYLIVGYDYGPIKMKQAIEQNITIIDQDRLPEYFDY